MNIQVSEKAAQWYKEELELSSESCIRYFVRYGGNGRIPGFSLGVRKEQPDELHTSIKVNDITFFIEESDLWYFDGTDLFVDFDEILKEPVFLYKTDT